MNQSWKSLVNKNVREIRFVLCQTGQGSTGVRRWINENFVELKKQNPDTLLLIRECQNAEATILTRYDYGYERKVACDYATSDEVEGIVSKLVLESEKINSMI